MTTLRILLGATALGLASQLAVHGADFYVDPLATTLIPARSPSHSQRSNVRAMLSET